MLPTFSKPTVRTCVLTMADHPLILPEEVDAILAFTETSSNWDEFAEEMNLPSWFVGSDSLWSFLNPTKTQTVRVYTAMIPDFDMSVKSTVLDVTDTFPFEGLTGSNAPSRVMVNINEDITDLQLWAVDWTVESVEGGVSITAQAILRNMV